MKDKMLALIAGILMVFSYSPFNLWLIAPFAIATLFYLNRNVSAKTAASHGFIFGLGWFGAGISWVHVSIDQFGGLPLIISISLMLLLCVYLALFPALAAYLTALLSKNKQLNLWLLPPVWLCTEYLRASVLTGFPWLFAGYSHLETPLAGYMPVASVYGSSMAVALCGSALIWLKDKPMRIAAGVTPLAVFAIGFGLTQIQWTQATGITKSVGLIQPNYSLHEKWDPDKFSYVMRGFIKQTQAVDSADIVVWPESAIPASYHRTHAWIELLSSNAEKSGYTLIAGQPFIDESEEPRKVMNSQWVFNPGEEIQFYFKNHL